MTGGVKKADGICVAAAKARNGELCEARKTLMESVFVDYDKATLVDGYRPGVVNKCLDAM